MMQFMPIIFGLAFYTAPSGLVLYWMTSTGIGIFEQLFIKKKLQAEGGEENAPPPVRKGPPAKTASPVKKKAKRTSGKKPRK